MTDEHLCAIYESDSRGQQQNRQLCLLQASTMHPPGSFTQGEVQPHQLRGVGVINKYMRDGEGKEGGTFHPRSQSLCLTRVQMDHDGTAEISQL